MPVDPRFADNASRVRHRRERVSTLEDRLGTQPAAYWLDALAAAGVPGGPVDTVAEAFTLAEQLGLAPVVRPQPGAPAAVACPIGGYPSLRRRTGRLHLDSANTPVMLDSLRQDQPHTS